MSPSCHLHCCLLLTFNLCHFQPYPRPWPVFMNTFCSVRFSQGNHMRLWGNSRMFLQSSLIESNGETCAYEREDQFSDLSSTTRKELNVSESHTEIYYDLKSKTACWKGQTQVLENNSGPQRTQKMTEHPHWSIYGWPEPLKCSKTITPQISVYLFRNHGEIILGKL